MVKDTRDLARFRVSFENRLSLTLRTLGAAAAWPIEAEQNAQRNSPALSLEELFELYFLTGHFPETSKRSQLTYLFRTGRPTVVLRETEEGCRGPCALYLHPIGYYGETWAGVMSATDEVMAHLHIHGHFLIVIADGGRRSPSA